MILGRRRPLWPILVQSLNPKLWAIAKLLIFSFPTSYLVEKDFLLLLFFYLNRKIASVCHRARNLQLYLKQMIPGFRWLRSSEDQLGFRRISLKLTTQCGERYGSSVMAYFVGCIVGVCINGRVVRKISFLQDLPQGSVMSSLLLLFYINSLHACVPQSLNISLDADDVAPKGVCCNGCWGWCEVVTEE